ncbi:MAG: hemerythrin domain-containing protein [Rubrivivax sp.]
MPAQRVNRHGAQLEAAANEGPPRRSAARRGQACDEVLAALLGEHQYIARMLKLLEDQIGLINQGRTPDARVMSDVMHYMTNFPDQYHHPKEELVFDKLVARDASTRSAVLRDTRTRRRKIVADGQALFELLERHRAGEAAADLPAIRERAASYIKLLRQHMDVEEQQLFPRARKALHAADWREVAERVKTVIDPVFGAEVAENYRALHDHYIESVREVEIGKLRARFEEAVALIEGLSSLIVGLRRIGARISEHNRAALRRNRELQRGLVGRHELAEMRATLQTMNQVNGEMARAVVADVRSLWNDTRVAATRPFQYVDAGAPMFMRWLNRAAKSRH